MATKRKFPLFSDNTLPFITNLLPLLSIGLPVLAMIDLITFYHSFDISIMTYLSFSEIITVFFQKIIVNSFMLCVWVAWEVGFWKERRKFPDRGIRQVFV